ncbi:MAG: MlaD family protein [candidate division WOR-3 bacterium]|jgi:phospholipid/cholesterol/gamma-HCH transport system substrate-binding protein
MVKREKAIKVGVFITLVLIFFVVGQLWLVRFNVGKSGYNLSIFYNDVSGLKSGDPVRVYGIKKGKVLDMKMYKDGVLVKVWIENSVVLRADAKASIQDVAMISGTKTIVVDPGTSDKILDASKILEGEANKGLSTVEIGGITDQIEELMSLLREAMGGETGTFVTLGSTLKEVESILKENRTELAKAIESGGEDLAKAELLIENMDSSIKELDLALKQINSKKGTVGKLIYDEKLYDNVTNAAASLDSLLVDFRKNPGKYVKVSVF